MVLLVAPNPTPAGVLCLSICKRSNPVQLSNFVCFNSICVFVVVLLPGRLQVSRCKSLFYYNRWQLHKSTINICKSFQNHMLLFFNKIQKLNFWTRYTHFSMIRIVQIRKTWPPSKIENWVGVSVYGCLFILVLHDHTVDCLHVWRAVACHMTLFYVLWNLSSAIVISVLDIFEGLLALTDGLCKPLMSSPHDTSWPDSRGCRADLTILSSIGTHTHMQWWAGGD